MLNIDPCFNYLLGNLNCSSAVGEGFQSYLCSLLKATLEDEETPNGVCEALGFCQFFKVAKKRRLLKKEGC